MQIGVSADSLQPFKVSAGLATERSVYKILNSNSASMGSMGLKNVIQANYQNYVSPFFLLDEFGPMQLHKGAPFRVDAHPHAGIIPTTYLFKGNAHHRDSMGNDFEYNEGEFIQFTSGKGALHMEETGDELYKHGGTFHGMQGWLNIPPHLKKSAPYASYLKKADIKVIETNDVTIRVILGEVFGVQSSTRLLMPVIYWHITMKENTVLELPIPPMQNAFIYLLTGLLQVSGGNEVKASQTVLYERDGDMIKIESRAESDLLVLGGEVNNEPFAARGPFVLNTAQELNQAFIDFESGKFGNAAQTNGIKRQITL